MAEHPNQLPVAPTNAAYGLAGLGVLGVERVALAVRHGLRHRRQRPECAYGRRYPIDPFERVRRVEVLGLATLTDLRDVRDSDFNACRHACK